METEPVAAGILCKKLNLLLLDPKNRNIVKEWRKRGLSGGKKRKRKGK